MNVFDERIRSPVLNFDGSFCAVMPSLFPVALRQKKGRDVWGWVNSYQREAGKGWGRSPCAGGILLLARSPTSASPHPREEILNEKEQS